jgi:hypothetical protein
MVPIARILFIIGRSPKRKKDANVLTEDTWSA